MFRIDGLNVLSEPRFRRCLFESFIFSRHFVVFSLCVCRHFSFIFHSFLHSFLACLFSCSRAFALLYKLFHGPLWIQSYIRTHTVRLGHFLPFNASCGLFSF